MLEKDVEAHLVKRIRGLGGLCLKFTSPQRVSVPDRLILLPGGVMCFVELKRPGGKPTAGQLREHERLRALGFDVHVIDTKSWVDALAASLKDRVSVRWRREGNTLVITGVGQKKTALGSGDYKFKSPFKKKTTDIHPGGQW